MSRSSWWRVRKTSIVSTGRWWNSSGSPAIRSFWRAFFARFIRSREPADFLGFDRLGAVTHAAENILSDLRSGRRVLDAALTSLILDSVDATKRMLAAIESGADEGPLIETGLLERLHDALNDSIESAAREPQAVEPPRAAPSDTEDAGTIHKEPPLAETSLRVDVGLLDRLMNLVGELVLTRNQVLQYNAGRDDSALNAISQRLNLITTELQEGVMKTRMQPIGVVWNKLPRVVRDLASLGKQIVLEMEGRRPNWTAP